MFILLSLFIFIIPIFETSNLRVVGEKTSIVLRSATELSWQSGNQEKYTLLKDGESWGNIKSMEIKSKIRNINVLFKLKKIY